MFQVAIWASFKEPRKGERSSGGELAEVARRPGNGPRMAQDLRSKVGTQQS